MLAFSRQQVLNTAPLDVNGLIKDMTGMLGRLIGEHIEVALVLAPDLPLVLAGRAGGRIAPGRHVRYPSETPMCNLLISMMERAGAPVARHGDSTGALRGLEG